MSIPSVADSRTPRSLVLTEGATLPPKSVVKAVLQEGTHTSFPANTLGLCCIEWGRSSD